MIDLHDDLAAALAQRYAVERELGHGGMAIVYLARDLKHARRVAIKVLRPDLASSIGGERFLREIAVAARLTHPNILALYDSGGAEGLLYYVMPFIEGETLRARLDREHQLPIDEALAIARQVAAALDYAHSQGVVHRDIKPENILITGTHVCVADFGLARALYTASTKRLTESAVAVGTPAYMSPEQAAADPDVDSRADVYSLGCVVYEMIAGMPPFKGATAQAVLAQHLTATPPSICEQRPHCPKAMDAAVQKAMEKIPADRFRTAGEFVRAMEGGAAAEVRSPAVNRRSHASRELRFGVGALAALGILMLGGLFAWRGRLVANDRAADPSSYAVMPVALVDKGAADPAVAQRIAQALGEWDGVSVVDARRVSDRLDGGRKLLSTPDALRAARSLGARRAVLAEETTGADSVRIAAALYDAVDGRELGRTAVSLAPAKQLTTEQARMLVNRLLRDRDELPWARAGSSDRPSLPAWLAYDRARIALEHWDLPVAERDLRTAVGLRDDFPQAQLWLARVQLWAQHLADWRAAARRAFDLRGRLTLSDSLAAEAQYALASEQYPHACALFSQLVALDSSGVPPWYGLAECQARDPVVIADVRSPSGYSFRGSRQQAAAALMHIIDDTPSPQPPFVYARLAEVLTTTGNAVRAGHLQGSSESFVAFPSLRADTLAYVPYRRAELTAKATVAMRGTAAALDHNRDVLRRVYVAWARSAPSSVEAHTALAALLEATEQLEADGAGALSAMDEVRRARMLPLDDEQRDSLSRATLRLLVKSGDWNGAAALSDSIIAQATSVHDDSSRSALGAAALAGRVALTAQLIAAHESPLRMQIATPEGDSLSLPAAVQHDVARLFASAAFGACGSALRDWSAQIDRRLESYVGDAAARAAMRTSLFRRPFSLAVPCAGPSLIATLPAGNDRLLLMQQAFAAGNKDSVRALWRTVRSLRSNARPGDVPIDYTYLESWLLAAIGDTSEAVTHLDRTLEALPTLGDYLLDYPSQPAALVRAMGLRAELATAARDRATARRWAAAVATLWRHADGELQPYVQRMTAIASRPDS